ncbi:hypothetical protein NG702_20555 [Pseudarthrobacter sp. MDT3-28]|uniref:hypothetical protein n=1 Tax=Pseudarthrobacter raffinosi TaxID=2953651 RepID=UPI00208F42F2|nr:hypothetical protein [Pseudarthrobacter sp. MDT3-28]MCO4239757.1 hypothetical protein [Pseudarthrobacter sp. MDT3-28]
MDTDPYSAALAAAMESSFAENPNTGQNCHGLADAYMASLPENTEGREEYDYAVRRSLERDNFAPPGEVVTTFNYKRVKAVRIAMKIAEERGQTARKWEL